MRDYLTRGDKVWLVVLAVFGTICIIMSALVEYATDLPAIEVVEWKTTALIMGALFLFTYTKKKEW